MKTIKQHVVEAFYYAEHKDEIELKLGNKSIDYQLLCFVIACSIIAYIVMLSCCKNVEQALSCLITLITVNVLTYCSRFIKKM